jgi:excinuclease ABC subunit A
VSRSPSITATFPSILLRIFSRIVVFPDPGLHFEDVKKLLKVLQQIVDKGNTVIVIEHNMDVIKSADWIIDLGPEGGDKGGEIIFSGTPENLVKCKKSHTGKFLKKELKN